MEQTWCSLLCLLGLTVLCLAQDDPCICLEQLGTDDLHNPTFMKVAPGDTERYYVGEQIGFVWIYNQDGSRNPEPFIDVSDRFTLSPAYDERGLLGMAFHPDFETNGKFYMYFSETTPGPIVPDITRLAEFMVDENNPDVADMDTERVILDFDQPASNHNGGEIMFGVLDGFLYIFTGDGGGSGDQYGNAQDMTSHLGKSLRIDVDTGDDGIPYLIPEDNPFLDEPGAEPEIYNLGNRNPWRCTIDPGDSETGESRGRMFCADVGQAYCEEVNIIVSGANCGWPVKECIYCYPPDLPDPDECIDEVSPGVEVLPIYWYTEWAGSQSITGGHVYRGSSIPAYNGDYFWTDWQPQRSGLNRLRENEDETWTNAIVDLCDASVCGEGLVAEHEDYAFAFGQGHDGEIFILESSSVAPGVPGGVVYKLVDPASKK